MHSAQRLEQPTVGLVGATTVFDISQPVSQPPATTIDARPVLARDPQNLWGRLLTERDRVFAAIEEVCKENNLETLVLKSNADVFPAWVRWECWLRRGEVTERVRLTITLEPQPHRRFDMLHRVLIENRGRPAKERLCRALEDETVKELCHSLLKSQHIPRLTADRIRQYPWKLWHLRNPLVALRADFATVVMWVAMVFGGGLMLFTQPGATVFDWLYQLRVFGRDLLGWEIVDTIDAVPILVPLLLAGAIVWRLLKGPGWRTLAALIATGCLAFLFQPWGLVESVYWELRFILFDSPAADMLWTLEENALATVAVVLCVLVVFFIQRARSASFVYSEGRPPAEPRYLQLGDYWHAVLPEIGHEAERGRELFLERIRSVSHDDLAVDIETIASVGPEGKEERDQVVLSFRRALVFCQFYAYGRDLYIGWDGFLNSGCWTEARVARGVSSKSGDRVIVNTVVPGRDFLTEYDLIDLNCAIEWTHTRLVELVKQIASEHKIDQEIDFAIQRADRAALLGSGDGDKKSGTGKRLRKLVRHG